MEELGSVDILVNNAGIQHTAPVESFPHDRWDAVIAINLSSTFHATQAVLPQDEGAATGAASSTSPRHTAWSPRWRSRPTWPPSTACWG